MLERARRGFHPADNRRQRSPHQDRGRQETNRSHAAAKQHPEKVIDFNERAIHETATTSKAIIRGFYSAAPKWSYFNSCANGGRQALVEAMGRRIELEHGPDGLIRRVSLHVPQSGFRHTYVDYEQDDAGDLVEVRNALGHPYRFAYDRHHMVRHTDRNGLSFHYEYD